MSWEIFGIPQGATYGNLRENRVTVIGVSLLVAVKILESVKILENLQFTVSTMS